MATGLTLRLLSAARHAYAITGDGPVAPRGPGTTAPASDCIGYGAPPQGVRSGPFNEDAGLVGSIPEGVVVAIRGTTPPRPDQDPRQVIVDWAGDAVATLLPAGGQPPGFPGKVHLGFYKSFMRLWDRLSPRVAAAVEAHPQKTIFVTGHSKGGAIAPLAAWRLSLDFPDHAIAVRTFAAARIGDGAFAERYNARLTDHIRYEFDDDIVPHLPLETALAAALGAPKVVAILLTSIDPGYGAVGKLAYVVGDGVIVADSPGPAADRVTRLVGKLGRQGGPEYVIACHGIDALSDGYVRAAYPA